MKNDELKIIEFAFLGCYGSRWCYFLFLRKNISPESSGLYQRSSINCAAVSSSEASIRPQAFISSIAALSAAQPLYKAAGLYQQRSCFIRRKAPPSQPKTVKAPGAG